MPTKCSIYLNDEQEPKWSGALASVPRVGEFISVGKLSLKVLSVYHVLPMAPDVGLDPIVALYIEEPSFTLSKMVRDFATGVIGLKYDEVQQAMTERFDREIENIGACSSVFSGDAFGNGTIMVQSQCAGTVMCQITNEAIQAPQS